MPVNVLCCVLLVTFTVCVSEWDLVCSRTALLSTVQGSYMGGVFVGCLFWGWASDKFGRKPSIMIAAVIQICSSVAAAFSVFRACIVLAWWCACASLATSRLCPHGLGSSGGGGMGCQ